jgi:uncharacterized membrane protein YgaE (UPF0421/DUF939 family)
MGCIVGLSTITKATSAPNLLPSSILTVNPPKSFVLEPLFATISGGILTSGVFFFFFKRMLDQYDKKHEKNDGDMKSLQKNMVELELNMTDKLHENSNELHQELNNNLMTSTKTIIDNLTSLRETIQDLVADLSTLKAEHNKCDYHPGDIKILQTQIASLFNSYARSEKKHKQV